MKTLDAVIFTLAPVILGLSAFYTYTVIEGDMPQLLPAAPYPGDNVIPEAVMVYDQTELIRAPPEAVWPWVLQVGKGRGGCKSSSSPRILFCRHNWHWTSLCVLICNVGRVHTVLAGESVAATIPFHQNRALRISDTHVRRYCFRLWVQRRRLLHSRRDSTEPCTRLQV